MKHIYRLLASALVLFTAAACYNEEIENPQDPDQQQSDFRITASIIQTRVSYNDKDAGHLDMKWQEGDMLYGFINGETKITFEVSGGTGGIAILVAASGSEDALSSLEGGETVDLVYIGNQTPSYDEDGNIIVSMTGQDPSGKIPACMSARDVVENTDGSKSLDFHFVNDCAIFEIESLAGDISGKALDKIQIPNLFTQGQYILGEDGFNFAGVPNSQSSNYEIDVDENKWRIIDGGVVTYNSEKQPLLMAVVPIGSDEAYSVELEDEDGKEYTYTPKITVNAIFSDKSNSTFTYGKSTIQCGICYVISAHPYVAKTEDNEYFETVFAAFEHAAELSEDESGDYDTAAENIVTLLKSEINGLGTEDAIEITYPVSLDLNNCSLTISDGKFYVDEGGFFTIIDSSEAEDGQIVSFSGSEIICNEEFATTIINKGNLVNDDLNVVMNRGNLSILDASLSSASELPTIVNYGILSIEGGKIFSSLSNAIYCNSGSEIHIGEDDVDLIPEIVSLADNYLSDYYCYTPAIFLKDASMSMNRGIISSFNDLVTGKATAIYVDLESQCEISGGRLESNLYTIVSDGEVTITGGELYSKNDIAITSYGILTIGNPNISDASARESISVKSDYPGEWTGNTLCPAIYCSYDGEFNMYYGDVIGKTGAFHVYSVTANIYGGYFESLDYETIRVLDGAECTISGGVICNKGARPTVICQSENTDDPSILYITWPKIVKDGELVQDKSYGETIHQPFIYSAPPSDIIHYFSSTPVSTTYSSIPNSAKVFIQGGYLISKTLASFYCDDDDDGNNLQVSSSDGFYSNVTGIYTQGSANSSFVDLYNDGSGKTIFGVCFYANPQGDASGIEFITPVGDKLTTGPLYYISKSSSSSSPIVQNDIYYFDGFDW